MMKTSSSIEWFPDEIMNNPKTKLFFNRSDNNWTTFLENKVANNLTKEKN